MTRHYNSCRGAWTPTYSTWAGMVQRCTNPARNNYHNYGGRGVAVCKRWMKFENFLADMGERPEGLTLDREDGSKNYCKSNCRWVRRVAQARNRRNNKLSERKAARIRTLYASGDATQRELGEQFQVSRTTIKHVIHRRTWA